MIRVGTAGWSYPDWEGKVYPRTKPRDFHPLRFLSQFIQCIEINSSFYALPKREHAKRWVDLVQDVPEFRFMAKLHQDFTHNARDPDPAAEEALAAQFLAGLEPLTRSGKLAGLLVQYPASFQCQVSTLRRVGRIRALFAGLPLILEVRHQSWFTPPNLDALRGHGYSLAYVDLPPAWNHPPDWHAPTGPLGYLRLHGRNSQQWFRRSASRDERYDYLYEDHELDTLARKARRIDDAHAQTYVITNNHFAGQALANALEMLFVLHGQPVAAPAEIVHSFPFLERITRVTGQNELF